MGCDYYIIKHVVINYENDTVDCIELSRDRGYFGCDADSDSDSEYHRTYDEKYGHYLKTNFKPIVLFNCETGWTNDTIKTKYEHKIKNKDKLEIKKITKEEYRCYR